MKKKMIIDEEKTKIHRAIAENAIDRVSFLERFLPNYKEKVAENIELYEMVEEEPELLYSDVKNGFDKVQKDIKEIIITIRIMKTTIKDTFTDLRHMIAFDSERITKVEDVLKNLSEQQLKLTQFITRK